MKLKNWHLFPLLLFLAACRTTEEMVQKISPDLLQGPAGESLRKTIASEMAGRERTQFFMGALIVIGITLLILHPNRPVPQSRKPRRKRPKTP